MPTLETLEEFVELHLETKQSTSSSNHQQKKKDDDKPTTMVAYKTAN